MAFEEPPQEAGGDLGATMAFEEPPAENYDLGATINF